VKGKIFRPEWGGFAVRDLKSVFDALQSRECFRVEGVHEGESAAASITRAALCAIDEALEADRARRNSSPGTARGPVFDGEQLSRIAAARAQLEHCL
jgi:hypothetical protein